MVHFTDRLRERRALVRRTLSREQARRVEDRVTDPCPSCGQPNHRITRQQAEPQRTSDGSRFLELALGITILVLFVAVLVLVLR